MSNVRASRWPFLLVAVLALVSQVAVASHNPALDDEPVSKCQDGSKHFCADGAPEDTGPCALCQASVGSPELILPGPTQIVDVAVAFALPKDAGPRSSLKFLSASPRAPPVG